MLSRIKIRLALLKERLADSEDELRYKIGEFVRDIAMRLLALMIFYIAAELYGYTKYILGYDNFAARLVTFYIPVTIGMAIIIRRGKETGSSEAIDNINKGAEKKRQIANIVEGK